MNLESNSRIHESSSRSLTRLHPYPEHEILLSDVEMEDGNQTMAVLKPVGRIGKKAQKKLKKAKANRRGKGKGKMWRKHV